ncbi:MAG: hypothetical protein H7144_12110 [Burkholderiales bacterium]|nr:hypothetical protein [Phycisphaerae bacterium]
MIFAPLKRMAALTLAAGGLIVAGCDDVKAGDKEVRDQLGLANKALRDADDTTLGTEAASEGPGKSTLDALKAAAADQNAGPVWRATAAGAAGDLQLQIATAQQVELNRIEQLIRATLSDLRALTQQVALTNFLADGYRKQDSKPALTSITALITSMQGDAQSLTWGLDDKKTLRTLAATKQSISNLQGQLAEQQGSITSLTSERQAAIIDSEKKFEAADKQKGAEAVRTYTEATESRRKAEEIAIKLDLATDQLKRVEADLALATGEQKALEAGIAALQEQANAVQAGGTDAATRVGNPRKIAASIATATAESPYAVNARAAELATLLQSGKAQRGRVNDTLIDAEKYYTDAITAAGSVTTDARMSRPELEPLYKGIKEAVNSGRYNLQQGVTQRRLGALSFDEAALLSEVESVRAMLQISLQAAQLATPQEWQAVEKSELTNLVQAADERLKKSNELLVNASAGASPKPTLQAAMLARMITLHKMIQLEALKEILAIPSNKQDSQTYLSDAQSLKTEIVGAGLRVPQVPGELGVMPEVAAPLVTSETPPAATATDTPESTAVKQAVENAIVQISDGNFKPVGEMVIVPEYLTASMQSVKDLIAALERYQQVVVAKFGEDGWKALSSDNSPGDASTTGPKQAIEAIRTQLAKVKFQTNGPTEVELLPETPNPEGRKILFRLTDGVWKLDLSALVFEKDQAALAIVGAMLGTIKQPIEQLTTDVEAGKYSTIDEVKAAGREMAKQAVNIPGLPPAPGGTPADPAN